MCCSGIHGSPVQPFTSFRGSQIATPNATKTPIQTKCHGCGIDEHKQFADVVQVDRFTHVSWR